MVWVAASVKTFVSTWGRNQEYRLVVVDLLAQILTSALKRTSPFKLKSATREKSKTWNWYIEWCRQHSSAQVIQVYCKEDDGVPYHARLPREKNLKTLNKCIKGPSQALGIDKVALCEVGQQGLFSFKLRRLLECPTFLVPPSTH